MEELEQKQRSVARAYEALTSGASSILNFTLQWKDLDCHYDSKRDSLRLRFEELRRREKEVEELAAEVPRLKAETETRAKELRKIEAAVEGKKLEVEQGKSRLLSIEALIEDFNEKLRVKVIRYSDVEKLIREKEKDLSEVEISLEKKSRKLNWVERRVEIMSKEVESKERDINKANKVLREYIRDVEVEEKKLNEIRGVIGEKRRELDLKEEEIVAVERSVEHCERELESKEERLGLVEESVANLDKMLGLKEKLIGVLDLKVSEVEKSMEEWLCKIEAKERELEGCVVRFKSEERKLESRAEELTVIETGVKECLSKVQTKVKELHSMEKSLKEHEKDLDLVRKVVQNHSRGSETNRDGRGLQEFMNERIERIGSIGNELSALLKESLDPGKLVLDAMQGFYPDNRELDFRLRRRCVLLLDEFRTMSPEIVPRVREEAIKLAADWKNKMTMGSESDLEVLGFLGLVAAYGLTSKYDTEELRRLLSSISHRQQAAQLSQVLGIADNAPESRFIRSPVNIVEPVTIEELVSSEEPETSLANNTATMSSPNLQSNSTIYARDSLGFLNEPLTWNLYSIQKEMLASVRTAVHPEKLVLNILQNSFVKYWTNEDATNRERVMLLNISVLEALIAVSPQFGTQVKEDAIKLAVNWNAKIRDNSETFLGIVGFMLFIITYELPSTFSGVEIVKLLERLSQHKNTPECQTHDFPVKTVAVFIRTLLERKQPFEALRFIFAFKLLEEFPPVPILNEYLEDTTKCRFQAWKRKLSVDEKVEFVDNQISGLRAMIECIKDNKVESECPFNGIELQISELEILKESWRDPRREQSQEKKRSTSTSSATLQRGQQHISKFRRTAEATPTASRLPTYIPIHLYAPRPSMAYGNQGRYGQFGTVPANFNEIDPNFGGTRNAGVHNPPLSYPPQFYRSPYSYDY